MNPKRIAVHQGDITKLHVDAIVNAANKSLVEGGGVSGAIYRAAGPELRDAALALGGAETGEAKATPGFNLPASYVFHAVGPIYQDGRSGEEELLASCYKNSLDLAVKYKCSTIAFPNISTGVYGYPREEAAQVAFNTVAPCLEDPKYNFIDQVIFVIYDDKNTNIYRKLISNYFSK